jgi:hypothetical protein
MRMIAQIKRYTERRIQSDFKWGSSLLAFFFYGTFVYFMYKKMAIFNLESALIPKLMTVLTVGFLFGNILNFPISYLLKLTSRIFRVNVKFTEIAKVLTIAYKPHLVSVLFVILSMTLNHYIDSNVVQNNTLIVFGVAMIINLTFVLVSICSLSVLFYGLMLILNLTLGKTILCFLIATTLFSPVYFLLMRL